MITNHVIHTIVTSSDFVECNGAKLYREPMKKKVYNKKKPL